MVKFNDELATQLIVVDNNGNRIIQIGPQPNITVNGLNGTKIVLGIEPSTMRPALLFYDASNNLKGFMVYDPANDNTFVGGPGGGISLTAGGDYFVDDTGLYGVFQSSGAPAFLQYYNNGNTEVWHPVNTFANGWSGNAQYKLMPDGSVRLRGSIVPGTRTGGTLVFTLPVGYRPIQSDEYMVPYTGGGFWNKLDINTDGTCIYFDGTGSGSAGTLGQISFSTI